MGNKKKAVIVGLVVLLALLALLPYYASGYTVSFVALVLMLIILCQGWNMFSGFTGYVSFGHHVYFGIGCYASAILLTRYGVSPYLSMLAAVALATALALIVSLATLRLKDVYFALTTLAVAIAVHVLSLNIAITGGGKGISLPPKYHLIEFFYVMLALALVAIGSALLIKNSRIGLALSAIKGDEDLAAAIGISSYKYKVLTLVLSAVLWAVAGNFYAWYVTFMHPTDAFQLHRLVTAMIGVIMGGTGSVGGVVIGATVFGVVSEVLWARFSTIYLMFLGIALVLIIRFAPTGLIKTGESLIQKVRAKGGKGVGEHPGSK